MIVYAQVLGTRNLIPDERRVLTLNLAGDLVVRNLSEGKAHRLIRVTERDDPGEIDGSARILLCAAGDFRRDAGGADTLRLAKKGDGRSDALNADIHERTRRHRGVEYIDPLPRPQLGDARGHLGER